MALANVALTDTFDVWRTRTNQIIVGLDAAEQATSSAYNKSNASSNIAIAAFNKANSVSFSSNLVLTITDNTNAAFRITQTGTAPAILVEDDTNPDATPFTVTGTGFVGIGTPSPSALFHIKANTVDEAARFESNTNPYISIYKSGIRQTYISTDNNAVYFIGETSKPLLIGTANANYVSIRANSSEKMHISANGLVGIGIVPTEKLHVQSGNVKITNTTDITPSTFWAGHLTVDANGYSGGLSFDNTAMWIGHNSSSRDLLLVTDEIERVRITQTGMKVTGTANVTDSLIVGTTDVVSAISAAFTAANSSNANAASALASAAFNKANAANVLAFSSGTTASAAFDKANSANVLVFNNGTITSAAFNKANTADTNAGNSLTVASAAFGKANAASLLTAKASTLAQSGGNGAAMTFFYSGQAGTPTWLWGTNDGATVAVWNPANFSVNYATSAGTATTAGYATSAGSATSATSATSASSATLATKASTLAQGGGNGTAMTFSYAGQSGTPTYVWGTNDGTSILVWSPANFSVNYATSAGSATNSTQLNGQAASYYTNISARLGYTPVNKAGDTMSGALSVSSTATAITGNGGASGYGVYGTSTSSYGIYGQSSNASSGGVIGYTQNASYYGILGYANVYSFYGLGVLYNAGEIRSTGNIIAYYSDKRLKTDIVRYTDWKSVIESVNAYRFSWNDIGQKLTGNAADFREVGFIAQEVQQAYPDGVEKQLAPPKELEVPFDENDPYLTIRNEKMIPVLFEAVKHLLKEVEDLKSKLNEKDNNK